MSSSFSPDPEKLNKFIEQGGEFFSWNKGKNTSNILQMLGEHISDLRRSLETASSELQHTPK
jgi:hypothetical protein